jgi:cyclophilin family peptidyl-prolyl cis-trans isomerase
MAKEHVLMSAHHAHAYSAAAACAALVLAGCGSSTTALTSRHLTSIQSAITCPPPPAHRAVAHPARAFTSAPAHVIAAGAGYCAYIATSRGTVSVRLRPEYAPNAVNTFVALAQHGFYDGLTFYQACPAATGPPCPAHAAAVMTGDPTGTGTGGPGYTVTSDPVIGDYLFGALAMASSTTSSIGSRFFISQGDSSGVARRYDIFGQATDGLPALATLQKGDTILWVAVETTAPEP